MSENKTKVPAFQNEKRKQQIKNQLEVETSDYEKDNLKDNSAYLVKLLRKTWKL